MWLKPQRQDTIMLHCMTWGDTQPPTPLQMRQQTPETSPRLTWHLNIKKAVKKPYTSDVSHLHISKGRK